jgi:hypothetical protein
MREHFLNADFDASLAGTASLPGSGDPIYLQEMAWHFLFAAEPEDSVILHTPLPAAFRAYLEAKGLPPPRTVTHPDFTREAGFVPFGWDSRALELGARYDRPPQAPDPAVVKSVNARSFGLALEREWYPDACAGALFTDAESLAAFLAARPATEAWVAKGEHGFAGTANRRIPGGPLSAGSAALLAPLFAGHPQVLLEPWHERLADMAVLFSVTEGGGMEGFRGHALLNSRDGAFLGVELGPDGQPPLPWRQALRENAERLAAALSLRGYLGPVGVDAYAYRTDAGPRLRPLVDINARRSMAEPAHGLSRRLPGRFLRWIWHKPRKLRLPAGYAELDARLGGAAFDPRRQEGILAVSPLFRERDPGSAEGGRREASAAQGGGRQPHERDGATPRRIGFALVAETEAGLERLQGSFAEALGRRA